MLFKSSLLVAAVVGIAQAQTPQGFSPSVNTKLDVMFNSTAVASPGQLLTKAGTATAPQIAAPADAVNSDDTYVFMMLDLDVPPSGSNSTRRVLLHAMTTGFKATQQKVASGSATLLATTQNGPASYIGPSPPPTDTVPHRYVQLLFQQPDSLQVEATQFADTQSRINFNVQSFAQQNGLGEPLAGNFFTVDGKAGASASGTATSSGGIVRNTLQPFEGAAVRSDAPFGLAAVLGAFALLV